MHLRLSDNINTPHLERKRCDHDPSRIRKSAKFVPNWNILMGDCLMMKSCGLYTRLGSLTSPPPSIEDFVDCWLCHNVHHQPSLAGNSECRWVRQESKCGDLQTADRRRSSSLSPVDAFKVKDQKPFTFFLVWWFKLILFPGIHQKGEVVSIENNSRENQSTPAVQHCKDVSYGEGI